MQFIHTMQLTCGSGRSDTAATSAASQARPAGESGIHTEATRWAPGSLGAQPHCLPTV